MSETYSNVWDALFDDRVEAENLRLRSVLMMAVSDHISDNNLTQKKAAELMGVSQPRISNLVKGKIDMFTIDTLVNMLARVGTIVELNVSPKVGKTSLLSHFHISADSEFLTDMWEEAITTEPSQLGSHSEMDSTPVFSPADTAIH